MFFNNGPGELKFDDTIDPIFYFLLDLVIGYKPWLNGTTACTYPEPWRSAPYVRKKRQTRMFNISSQNIIKNIERYVGTYSNPLYGKVTFTEGDDHLFIKYGTLLEGNVTSSFTVNLNAPLDEVLFSTINLQFKDLGTTKKYESVLMRLNLEQYIFTRMDDINGASNIICDYIIFVPFLVRLIYMR